jgi:hypothetical protein
MFSVSLGSLLADSNLFTSAAIFDAGLLTTWVEFEFVGKSLIKNKFGSLLDDARDKHRVPEVQLADKLLS